MHLTLAIPGVPSIGFMTEATTRLPPKAHVASCVDPAYWAGDRNFDFNVWALAQQQLGVERLYISDQEYYRGQSRDQVQAGFAMPTHDWPHRYLAEATQGARTNQTSYGVYLTCSNAYFALCLHEHWYDEWIFASHSTDEFFTYEPSGSRMEPRSRTTHNNINNLVPSRLYQSIHDFLGREDDVSPCTALLCVVRPFYSPPTAVLALAGEPSNWTHPNTPSMRLKFSIPGGKLAVERFTRRHNRLPPRGSVRKCFVHPGTRGLRHAIREI
jgi:hypothetical protein